MEPLRGSLTAQPVPEVPLSWIEQTREPLPPRHDQGPTGHSRITLQALSDKAALRAKRGKPTSLTSYSSGRLERPEVDQVLDASL